MFGFFGSKSIRCSGAILVAGLLPAMGYAATSTIEVKVESKSFLSGSRTLQLEDGVPQTVTLQQPVAEKFDGRCSIFGLIEPDGGIPTTVKIDITANRVDDKNVMTVAKILARKAGDVRETLVSARGDRANCPTISGISTEVSSMVRAGESTRIFDAQGDKRDIEVVLSVK